MATRASHLNSSSDSLVHYLRPALDDLRQLDMPFETYLLEMLMQALREKAAAPGTAHRLHAVP